MVKSNRMCTTGLWYILVPWLSPAIVRSVPITSNSRTKRSCSRLQHRYKATRKLAISRSVKHRVKKNCVATKKPAKKISQWISTSAAILTRYTTHNQMYLFSHNLWHQFKLQICGANSTSTISLIQILHTNILNLNMLYFNTRPEDVLKNLFFCYEHE